MKTESFQDVAARLNLHSWNQVLGHFLSTGRFSDAVLIVSDGVDEKRFAVHKLVLSLASARFAALFHGPDVPPNQIDFNILEPQRRIFDKLLELMYSSEAIPIDSVHDGVDLYALSDEYASPRSVHHCREYLKMAVDAQNAGQILALANRFDDRELEEACRRFRPENAADDGSSNAPPKEE